VRFARPTHEGFCSSQIATFAVQLDTRFSRSFGWPHCETRTLRLWVRCYHGCRMASRQWPPRLCRQHAPRRGHQTGSAREGFAEWVAKLRPLLQSPGFSRQQSISS